MKNIKFFTIITISFIGIILLLIYNRLEGKMSLGRKMRLAKVRDSLKAQRICGNCKKSTKIQGSPQFYIWTLMCRLNGEVKYFAKYPHCKDFESKE